MVALERLNLMFVYSSQACANHPLLLWCFSRLWLRAPVRVFANKTISSFVTVPFNRIQLLLKLCFIQVFCLVCLLCLLLIAIKDIFVNELFFIYFSLLSPFQFISGASLSDRSQTETNIGEERISLRRSLTDSLAVSSMLLLQPQQVSLVISHFEAR